MNTPESDNKVLEAARRMIEVKQRRWNASTGLLLRQACQLGRGAIWAYLQASTVVLP